MSICKSVTKLFLRLHVFLSACHGTSVFPVSYLQNLRSDDSHVSINNTSLVPKSQTHWLKHISDMVLQILENSLNWPYCCGLTSLSTDQKTIAIMDSLHFLRLYLYKNIIVFIFFVDLRNDIQIRLSWSPAKLMSSECVLSSQN